VNGPVYLAVGIAMAIAGWLILTDRVPHFHPMIAVTERDLKKHITAGGSFNTPSGNVPTHWCIIHGFISGFGTDGGILSTWIYILTIPYLVSYDLWYLAPFPGLLFGVGTFVVLMTIGFVFGETLQIAKRVGPNRIAHFGRRVGARTLLLGGLVFIGFSPLYWSGLYGSYFGTFDAGTFIVVLVLIVIAVPIMLYTWKEVRTLPRDFPTHAIESGRTPGESET